MPAEPAILSALAAAVAAAPDGIPLRVHYATMLVEAGRPAEALAECQAALGYAPDDAAALALAARAARLTGETGRAEAYERLIAPNAALAPEPPPMLVPLEPVPKQPEQEPVMGDVVPIRLFDSGSSADDIHDVEVPTVRLADVGGMEQVKRRLDMAFLAPMRNPQLREMYGKSLRGGLLLFGPPGCGKTFVARATAGELGARFVAVGLSDVLDMYFGQSERNLHELFETARRKAPCVLFLDEVDALVQKRTNARHQPMWRSVVAQLLNEMDSVSADNEGVFILGATNAPWDVDTALRRTGRFDRMLLVLPPDPAARAAIIQYHLANRPVDKGIDFASLASRTDGYSGADLAHACESAAEFALDDSLASGVARPITRNDMGIGVASTVGITVLVISLVVSGLHPPPPAPTETVGRRRASNSSARWCRRRATSRPSPEASTALRQLPTLSDHPRSSHTGPGDCAVDWRGHERQRIQGPHRDELRCNGDVRGPRCKSLIECRGR